MRTKGLIDAAVINSTTTGSKGFADQLFAHWFNRLVYAQIWEDPRLDLEALALAPGARVLTISSGGCNALAYLSADPASVHVVDLNEAHLAMLELKRAALRGLTDRSELLAFLAEADRPDNLARFRQHVAPRLPAEAARWWARRDLLGRPRAAMFTRHAYRHGLLGRFIGLGHALVRLLGGDLSAMTRATSMDEQRALFQQHVAPALRHPLVRWLARWPAAVYSLGIPPAQYQALQADAEAEGVSLPQLFEERMRHLACDFPYGENCFAAQAFARRYDAGRDAQLPMYLQAAHHEAITARLDRLHPRHETLTGFLRSRPAASMDAYVFLDAQDWMDDAQLRELWDEVNRTAAPGARVLFRSGGSASPLEARLPAGVLAPWRTDPARNRRLYARDRSAIYGGVHLYERVG